MENKELAPILLFTYNRPKHTSNLLKSLLQNKEAAESNLYVYLDGPKNTEEIVSIDKIEKIVNQLKGFKSITLIKRDTNWGLAKNIIQGVTEQIEKHQRVIVLEDDLIVSPYFLQFMNDALTLYDEEKEVGHIQACDFTQNKRLPDTFLIKWTGSWGWATWERAWSLFNPNGRELLDKLEKKKLCKTFDFNGAYPFTRMLRRQIAGENNSWAIRWNASLFLANKLSLNVGKSLVDNRGFDGSGTHCGSQDIYQSNLWQQPLPVKKHQPIKENQEARLIFEQYYKRTNSFYAKVKRRLQRILNGDFSL